MMDGEYTAVVDRIVDGETAVLLLEDGDEVVEQRDVPVEILPDAARSDGGVLRVSVEGDTITDYEYLPDETAERRERAQERFDRLSKRLSEE